MLDTFLHSPLFEIMAGALLGALLLVPIAVLNAHFRGMPTLVGIALDQWVFNALLSLGVFYRRGPAGVALFVAAFVVLTPWAYGRMVGFINDRLMDWESMLITQLARAGAEGRRLTADDLRKSMKVNDFFIGYTLGKLVEQGIITARREGTDVIIEFARAAHCDVMAPFE